MNLEEIITPIFLPILQPIFSPINDVLAAIYMPWAKICALGMFAAAIVGVFCLKKDYLNVDAPNKTIFTDLRLWTIAALTPHIIVYLYLG